ncbi:MAG TPA: oligopeptide/dipeptide ABC transporter ATP-binding protein, partial [Chloroflexota bacterium]|nr:oligopeptide/dipeptide ABC transporter ATP-binding protein [Chloroflexota bacterium]
PSGCRFHTRCPIAADVCRVDEPAFREITPGHWAACHFAEDSLAA